MPAPARSTRRLQGDPLLLISGLGQGSWVWRNVMQRLVQDRRVVTIEHRGTGRLGDAPARDSIAEMADDAAGELDAPAHVLGFSMGGYVALTLALRRPDLVRSLILAGTGAGGSGRVPRPAHVAAAFDEAFGGPYEEFGRKTMPYTFAPGWAEANAARFEEILAARLERPTPYATIEAHVRACFAFYDAGCGVERIDVPTLVFHGAEDLIVPVENGRMLAARLRNVRYVELPGRGHNLMLEDPEAFERLVLEHLERVE